MENVKKVYSIILPYIQESLPILEGKGFLMVDNSIKCYKFSKTYKNTNSLLDNLKIDKEFIKRIIEKDEDIYIHRIDNSHKVIIFIFSINNKKIGGIIFISKGKVYKKHLKFIKENCEKIFFYYYKYKKEKQKREILEKILDYSKEIKTKNNIEQIIKFSTHFFYETYNIPIIAIAYNDSRRKLNIYIGTYFNIDEEIKQKIKNEIVKQFENKNIKLIRKSIKFFPLFHDNIISGNIKNIYTIIEDFFVQQFTFLALYTNTKLKSHEKKYLEQSTYTLYSHINLILMYENIKENYLKTVKALAIAVDAKDEYTHTHSENVSRYAEKLCKIIGLNPQETESIKNAALLHDIGKIGIPGYILNKPGALNKDEYDDVMKQHVIIGANILKNVPFFTEISDLVLHHHEKWDGTGYPDGLKGEKIPLGSRIIAICDVYDALTTDRPYRKAMSIEEALKIIKKEKSKYFDPKLTDIFINIILKENKK